MDSDGQNVVRLTQVDEQNISPVWSPDGKSIAYYDMTNGLVKVIDANGGNLRVLSDGSYPSWFDPAFARKYAVNPLSKISTLWGKLKEK